MATVLELVRALNNVSYSIAKLYGEDVDAPSETRIKAVHNRLIKLDEILDMIPVSLLAAYYRKQLANELCPTLNAKTYLEATMVMYTKIELVYNYELKNLSKVKAALKEVAKIETFIKE